MEESLLTPEKEAEYISAITALTDKNTYSFIWDVGKLKVSYMLLKNICGLIDDLNTTSEDVILDTLDSIYETFHQRADMNEYDFILAMSKLIEMLIKEKNN